MSAKIHDAIKRHMVIDVEQSAASYFDSAQLMKIPSFTLNKRTIDDFVFGYRNVNAGKFVTEGGKPVKVEGEYIIVTENSIYVVSAEISTKRIS